MNLKDLADLLGLSPTTVSRALNGFPEVAEATRKRVEEAAQLHHYRPNTQAKRLATGRAMAIGHVIPLCSQHEIVNPVFADFIAGAGEVYAREGYDMVLISVPVEDHAQAYRELRAKRNVDGVIVHAPRAGDGRIALLHELGLPFVVHGRASGVDLPYAYVDVNNARAFERATNFLLDLGHRRIALLNGVEGMDFALRRQRGFARAFAARGLEPDPSLMIAGEMTEAQGHDAACDMLRRADPPTAFITASLLSAVGVRRGLWELGLRMGRDVSILTHDDELGYFRNGAEEPIFTATRASVREAGRRCASLLLDMIATPDMATDMAPATQLMEAVLVLGASTGPAPDRSVPPMTTAQGLPL
ncbi:LacI family transcriptional regulator [Rhodobacter aestuarii]|uniref:Transcriptional regulator, LacI family n=1 Tax=Rhodobacter aestuarii TaxID=453582 RepID=A0A1N7J9T4_9RHOB|nr:MULTISPECIES: substrate-binding domain-containing protein [Rhodobacter]PTV97020.1 LacI family transcriptional regulator [Rhodobacter aestuarii]SIS46095.1 transcriptional regulator, LacI family [Rhodobacter aestuarii]